jgi:hypothetical protein
VLKLISALFVGSKEVLLEALLYAKAHNIEGCHSFTFVNWTEGATSPAMSSSTHFLELL